MEFRVLSIISFDLASDVPRVAARDGPKSNDMTTGSTLSAAELREMTVSFLSNSGILQIH